MVPLAISKQLFHPSDFGEIIQKEERKGEKGREGGKEEVKKKGSYALMP